MFELEGTCWNKHSTTSSNSQRSEITTVWSNEWGQNRCAPVQISSVQIWFRWSWIWVSATRNIFSWLLSLLAVIVFVFLVVVVLCVKLHEAVLNHTELPTDQQPFSSYITLRVGSWKCVLLCSSPINEGNLTYNFTVHDWSATEKTVGTSSHISW